MAYEMAASCVSSPGALRIDEVDADLVLPQILRLRATVGRTVSLASDLTPWLDPLDPCAMHWGIFRDAELVAAARLCVHASADRMVEATLRSLASGSCGPVAVISHCVVHPHLRGLRLEAALDAARIERARQLRIAMVLAVAKGPRRIAALEAQGFDARATAADGSHGMVLHLARPSAQVIRMPVPSRR